MELGNNIGAWLFLVVFFYIYEIFASIKQKPSSTTMSIRLVSKSKTDTVERWDVNCC